MYAHDTHTYSQSWSDQQPHVAPGWLFSSLYLVNINSAFIIFNIEVFCCEAVCPFFLQYSATYFFRRPAPPLPLYIIYYIIVQTTSATLAETLCATTRASSCRGARRHLHICLSCLSSVFLSPPIINQLVPGGCDHPQQGVQSRAGDRGVQSHNQVRPPSTQSQNH